MVFIEVVPLCDLAVPAGEGSLWLTLERLDTEEARRAAQDHWKIPRYCYRWRSNAGAFVR